MFSWILALAAGGLCAGGAACFYFLVWRGRPDRETVRAILRLAGEIDVVAATVETDLESVADEPPSVVLRQRCREARERSTEALAQGKGLQAQDREALITTLLLLHDDHRRIVDLRSEVDRAVARKAKPAGEDRSRIIHVARARPSVWANSSLLTRPSTFT